MGVVVRRLIDIFPTPLVLASSFLAAASLLCSFKNVFSVLFPLFLTIIYIANAILKEHSRSFQKIENTRI